MSEILDFEPMNINNKTFNNSLSTRKNTHTFMCVELRVKCCLALRCVVLCCAVLCCVALYCVVLRCDFVLSEEVAYTRCDFLCWCCVVLSCLAFWFHSVVSRLHSSCYFHLIYFSTRRLLRIRKTKTPPVCDGVARGTTLFSVR